MEGSQWGDKARSIPRPPQIVLQDFLSNMHLTKVPAHFLSFVQYNADRKTGRHL
jgi:hypothetical protein